MAKNSTNGRCLFVLSKWKLEKKIVMSCLLNPMVNEIGEKIMYYNTARQMWDAMKDTY